MIQEIAPHQLRNEYLPQAKPSVGDPVFYVRGQDVAVRHVDEDSFDVPRVGSEEIGRAHV